jgi:GMC oxidoreductase
VTSSPVTSVVRLGVPASGRVRVLSERLALITRAYNGGDDDSPHAGQLIKERYRRAHDHVAEQPRPALLVDWIKNIARRALAQPPPRDREGHQDKRISNKTPLRGVLVALVMVALAVAFRWPQRWKQFSRITIDERLPGAQAAWLGQQGRQLRVWLSDARVINYGNRFDGLAAAPNNHFDALAAVRTDPDAASPDTHILFCDVALPPPGQSAPTHGYTIEFSMLDPHSRGTVRLASPDPTAAPLIDPGFFTDQRDVAFMMNAARAARHVGDADALAPWRDAEIIPGPQLSTDEQLRAYLRRSIGTYFHPVGTCRIGTDTDAVTDTELRVHAVEGLRVADASVMPSLPAANPNATVLAIAEKAADLLRASP